MNHYGCDLEIVSAQRLGAWSEEQRAHLAACPHCSEALRVAQALRLQTSQSAPLFHAPNPHWVWQRAQKRIRERALRRMTRLLTAAQVLAAVYAVLAVA